MAKLEGDQTIPSALLDLYRGTLTEKQPDGTSRKRYPYRVPNMQKGGADVKPDQLTQRARFEKAIENFAGVSEADRERWYAARPPWSSYLWYYNYFIMSDLMGNANLQQGGIGVIKSIQFKTIAMPAHDGEGSIAITTVDIAKTVVMLYGNSIIVHEEELYAFTIPSYPYVSDLAAELLKCKWAISAWGVDEAVTANIGAIIIEYI